MKIQIKYGKYIIIPKIERSSRKSIAISVLPSRDVLVKAPQTIKLDVLQNLLNKKAAWIVKQQNYFNRFHPLQPQRQYQSGETHYYLGRQYRLKIEENHKDHVGATSRSPLLKGKYFHVALPDGVDMTKIRYLLNAWYLEHARKIFINRLRIYWPSINLNGRDYPAIQIRIMRKSWGSCSRNQRITLNLELVKASLYCIDYVLVHELCHLLHPRHDNKFYWLLRKTLPDWQKRKERLATSEI